MGPSGRHRKLHKVYYIFVPEININTINIWHFDRLFITRIQSSTNGQLFKIYNDTQLKIHWTCKVQRIAKK